MTFPSLFFGPANSSIRANARVSKFPEVVVIFYGTDLLLEREFHKIPTSCLHYSMEWNIFDGINQSIDLSINQSINQSTGQASNQQFSMKSN